MATLGIIFALGALLSWGFGDFFIQKTVRAVGDLKTLFLIDAIGALVLLPFIWGELPITLSNPSHVLLLTELV